MAIYFICTQIVDLCGVSIQNLSQKSNDLAVMIFDVKNKFGWGKKQIWMGKHEKIS